MNEDYTLKDRPLISIIDNTEPPIIERKSQLLVSNTEAVFPNVNAFYVNSNGTSWLSVSQAKTYILSKITTIPRGLTILVGNTEYWWIEGEFILKIPTSGGGGEPSDSDLTLFLYAKYKDENTRASLLELIANGKIPEEKSSSSLLGVWTRYLSKLNLNLNDESLMICPIKKDSNNLWKSQSSYTILAGSGGGGGGLVYLEVLTATSTNLQCNIPVSENGKASAAVLKDRTSGKFIIYYHGGEITDYENISYQIIYCPFIGTKLKYTLITEDNKKNYRISYYDNNQQEFDLTQLENILISVTKDSILTSFVMLTLIPDEDAYNYKLNIQPSVIHITTSSDEIDDITYSIKQYGLTTDLYIDVYNDLKTTPIKTIHVETLSGIIQDIRRSDLIEDNKYSNYLRFVLYRKNGEMEIEEDTQSIFILWQELIIQSSGWTIDLIPDNISVPESWIVDNPDDTTKNYIKEFTKTTALVFKDSTPYEYRDKNNTEESSEELNDKWWTFEEYNVYKQTDGGEWEKVEGIIEQEGLYIYLTKIPSRTTKVDIILYINGLGNSLQTKLITAAATGEAYLINFDRNVILKNGGKFITDKINCSATEIFTRTKYTFTENEITANAADTIEFKINGENKNTIDLTCKEDGTEVTPEEITKISDVEVIVKINGVQWRLEFIPCIEDKSTYNIFSSRNYYTYTNGKVNDTTVDFEVYKDSVLLKSNDYMLVVVDGENKKSIPLIIEDDTEYVPLYKLDSTSDINLISFYLTYYEETIPENYIKLAECILFGKSALLNERVVPLNEEVSIKFEDGKPYISLDLEYEVFPDIIVNENNDSLGIELFDGTKLIYNNESIKDWFPSGIIFGRQEEDTLHYKSGTELGNIPYINETHYIDYNKLKYVFVKFYQQITDEEQIPYCTRRIPIILESGRYYENSSKLFLSLYGDSDGSISQLKLTSKQITSTVNEVYNFDESNMLSKDGSWNISSLKMGDDIYSDWILFYQDIYYILSWDNSDITSCTINSSSETGVSSELYNGGVNKYTFEDGTTRYYVSFQFTQSSGERKICLKLNNQNNIALLNIKLEWSVLSSSFPTPFINSTQKISNIEQTAEHIISEVSEKVGKLEYDSTISQLSDEIDLSVKVDGKTHAGLTLNENGSTFKGDVKATNFLVIDELNILKMELTTWKSDEYELPEGLIEINENDPIIVVYGLNGTRYILNMLELTVKSDSSWEKVYPIFESIGVDCKLPTEEIFYDKFADITKKITYNHFYKVLSSYNHNKYGLDNIYSGWIESKIEDGKRKYETYNETIDTKKQNKIYNYANKYLLDNLGDVTYSDNHSSTIDISSFVVNDSSEYKDYPFRSDGFGNNYPSLVPQNIGVYFDNIDTRHNYVIKSYFYIQELFDISNGEKNYYGDKVKLYLLQGVEVGLYLLKLVELSSIPTNYDKILYRDANSASYKNFLNSLLNNVTEGEYYTTKDNVIILLNILCSILNEDMKDEGYGIYYYDIRPYFTIDETTKRIIYNPIP